MQIASRLVGQQQPATCRFINLIFITHLSAMTNWRSEPIELIDALMLYGYRYTLNHLKATKLLRREKLNSKTKMLLEALAVSLKKTFSWNINTLSQTSLSATCF